jgi:hypothetical protein
MTTLWKRRRSPSPVSDDDGSLTDSGVAPTPSRGTAASSSIEIIDSDDADKAPHKRRRRNTSSDAAEGLLALMEKESERRRKHDEKIESSFDAFVENNRKQKDDYISLLKDLIAKDT